MKRLYLIIGLVVLASMAWGAVTVVYTVTRPIIASKSVTTQQTATAWTMIDSIRILQAGDSSASWVGVSGEVELQPGQKMYCGWGHTVATKTLPDIDTFIFIGNPNQPGAKLVRLPFHYRYARADSVAVNDTFYFCASSSDTRPLTLRNIVLTGQTGGMQFAGKLATRF